MNRLYILILTILCSFAVSAQTLNKSDAGSAGIFSNSSSGEKENKDSGSSNNSNSGFFRVGSTENPSDGGGATKEAEAPLDPGNGILFASVLFAASYMLVKIRKEKKR